MRKEQLSYKLPLAMGFKRSRVSVVQKVYTWMSTEDRGIAQFINHHTILPSLVCPPALPNALSAPVIILRDDESRHDEQNRSRSSQDCIADDCRMKREELVSFAVGITHQSRRGLTDGL